MKNFKFLYLLLAVVGVVTFTSCKEEWAPGAQDANMGVYFPETNNLVVAAEDTSVEILVKRNQTAEAAQVSVLSEDKSKLFTVPSSIDFAAGAEEAVLKITFDGKALTPGTTYPISIQLEQAQASAYGVSEFVFNITLPEPWLPMGTGIYVDDFYKVLFEALDMEMAAGYTAPIEFQQHADNPNRIRVVNPASQEMFGTLFNAVPGFLVYQNENPSYIEFDITDPNNVLLSSNPTDLNVSGNFGDDGVLPFVLWVIANEDGSYAAPIVLNEGKIIFPKENVIMGYIFGGELYGWQANAEGKMMFALPGVELTDYTISALYSGMFVSPDNTSAAGIFQFSLGADVESYKFTFVSGDVTADYSEVVASIVDGTAENIFESSTEDLVWQVGLEKGAYTLVAVPYSASGAETANAFAYNFYFNGLGETPEVDIDVEIGVPSELVAADRAEQMATERPGCFNVGVKITANPDELKAIKFWYGDGASVDKAGITYDQLFNEYGGDASSVWIPQLVENNGSVVGIFNVVAGSTVTVFLRFETIYGTNVDMRCEPYTLPEYDGDMYTGYYAFADGENQMVFGVAPGKSYNDFFFTHPMIDGSMWYATYDAKAATFTVSGIEYQYEQYDNQYGGVYGLFDEEGTMVYGYNSSVSADFKTPSDPMVFKVENNQLAALNTYFAMIVYKYDAAANKVTEIVGPYFTFTPATVIAPYSVEPTASALSVGANAKKASFECGEAFCAGAANNAEVAPMVKAQPVQGYNIMPSVLKR